MFDESNALSKINKIQNDRKRQNDRTTSYQRNQVLKIVQTDKTGPTSPRVIPRCPVLNARSLIKPDALPALYADLKCNEIDICCISETWLKPVIPNYLVCPDGYSIVKKIELIAEAKLQLFAETIAKGIEF